MGTQVWFGFCFGGHGVQRLDMRSQFPDQESNLGCSGESTTSSPLDHQGTLRRFCLGRWDPLGMEGANDGTTTWRCLMLLNCTLKNGEVGKFYVMYILFYFIIIFKLYGHTCGIWRFLGQGLNLSCSSGNAGSFNPLHWAGDQTSTSPAP